MGRSVSTPRDCINVAYATFDGEEFHDALYGLRSVARSRYKSLTPCDTWVGREDHALLENSHAHIGVPEYCGLVSMWVAPVDDDYASSTGLREKWIDFIGAKFQKVARNSFGQFLIKQGSVSSGEAFFQPVNGKQQGSMGLGYSSKCGCAMKRLKHGFWSRPRSCLMRRPRLVRNGWLHK